MTKSGKVIICLVIGLLLSVIVGGPLSEIYTQVFKPNFYFWGDSILIVGPALFTFFSVILLYSIFSVKGKRHFIKVILFFTVMTVLSYFANMFNVFLVLIMGPYIIGMILGSLSNLILRKLAVLHSV